MPSDFLFFQGAFARMGGVEVLTRDLAAALRARGHGVTVVYWTLRERSPLLDEIAALGCRMIEGSVTRGVRWELPDRALVHSAREALGAARTVVLTKFHTGATLSRLFEAAPRARFALFPAYLPAQDDTYIGKEAPRDAIARLHLVFAACPEMARQLRDVFGYAGRIETVPLLTRIAAAPQAMPPLEAHDPVRFGYFGRLVPQKNLPALLEAFGLYLQGAPPPNAELHVFGGGDMEAELRAHAAAIGHPGRVVFHGSYATPDLPSLVRNIHVAAMASVREGQCLSALEMMAMGRPLLAAKAGCLEDVLDRESVGAVVPDASPEAFAAAMRTTEGRARAGAYDPQAIAAHFRARFSAEVVEPRTVGLLEELAASERR